MSKGRMEAFSDGVIAILITIMVLEMKVPHGSDLSELIPVWPVFLSYILSYIFLGIYWSNHHHLLQAIKYVDGKVLWANLHLLFWLSLTPFVTGWMGENAFSSWPAAFYGIVLLGSSIAYYILVQVLLTLHGTESAISIALGKDIKGRISVVIYIAAIPLAFISSLFSIVLYVSVAIMWFVPDRRIEKTLVQKE